MREEDYNTPYDDLSTYKSRSALGKPLAHRILGGAEEYDIRYFENRTVGISARAQDAVATLNKVLHSLKRPIMVLAGDFIGSANNECIHNKEIHQVNNPAAQKERWLMKTVNVKLLTSHAPHIIAGSERIVNG